MRIVLYIQLESPQEDLIEVPPKVKRFFTQGDDWKRMVLTRYQFVIFRSSANNVKYYIEGVFIAQE